MTDPRPQKESELPDLSSPCFVYLSCPYNFHINTMQRCLHQKNNNQGHRNFKAFYDLYCSLEFFGFCFLKTIKSIFKIFVCYILRLCAWHKKWYLISPCWVTWVIRELLGTRICHVGSMKSCCLKHWTNPDHYSLKTCSLKDACCALVALPRLNSHFFVAHSTSVGNRGICV